MADVSSPPAGRSNSTSPPPKCAICLGTFSNKCYSDSCMHQFCFTCLLEWSKVKAECPLCKQPFKSIIHNIKSNSEYDEHIITRPEVPVPDERGVIDNDRYLYLPHAPSRHFQFRTTFTVDPGGELAIQQMLLSHPLTNPIYNMPTDGGYATPRPRFARGNTRRASSATSFRRSIYMQDLWVYPPPDFGRYRDIRPDFYRENPVARNRLVPWLNRELNALLFENTQQIMNLVDIIMDYLLRHHIRSRPFRNLLYGYLGNKTDHFIHEFFNFMRSPFDMIGYDRHIIYIDRPHSPVYSISDHDDESDSVAVVNSSEPVNANNNPFRRPTIEVIEINSDTSNDSDVILREPTPPVVVDLLDSDSDDVLDRAFDGDIAPTEESDREESRKPILPLKIRLKHKRQSKEKRSRNRKRYKHDIFSSSNSSNDSSSSSSDTSHKRSKRKYKYDKYRKGKHRSSKDYKSRGKDKSKNYSKPKYTSDSRSSSDSLDDEPLITRKRKIYSNSNSEDDLPLSKIRNKERKKAKKVCNDEASSQRSYTVTSKVPDFQANCVQSTEEDDLQLKPCCSSWGTNEADSPSTNIMRHSLTHTDVSDGRYTPPFNNMNFNNPNMVMTNPNFNMNNYADFGRPYSHLFAPASSREAALPQFNNLSWSDNVKNESVKASTSSNNYFCNPPESSFLGPISLNSMYEVDRDVSSCSRRSTYNSSRDGTSSNFGNSPLFENSLNRNGYMYDNDYQNKLDDKHEVSSSQSTIKLSPYESMTSTSAIKSELKEQDYDSYVDPIPCSSGRLRSVIVKKENSNMWYSRPYNKYNGDSSDN